MPVAAAETASPAAHHAELIRGLVTRDGAFGMLTLDGIPVAVTCERTYPVAESAPEGPQFVKIPPGEYTCRRTMFHKGGYETFEITGVVGHSRLLFHCGNRETDSEGCVLLGLRYGLFSGAPAVIESVRAFTSWMLSLRGVERFSLTVKQCA